MITFDDRIEYQLNDIANKKGLSVAQLINEFIDEYRSEAEAIKRADEAYQDYLQTGETVTLQQLIKDNGLDN